MGPLGRLLWAHGSRNLNRESHGRVEAPCWGAIADPAQHERYRSGLILPCMGLFSRFWVPALRSTHRYPLLRRWNWQTSDGIALPVGDLGIRMRNDGHEPNGAKQQRPERIPIEPEHRGRSGDLVRSGAIDSLLQSGRRLEHDNATRSNPHLDAALRLAADTRGFLGVFCHSSVSLQY